MTNFAKYIEAKIKAARRGDPPAPVEAEGRRPPGQHLVGHLPVLDLGIRPLVEKHEWRLELFGLVAQPLALDWDTLNALSPVETVADIHCVTRWSRLAVRWQGVRGRDVVELAQPKPEARFVTLHGYDGYTTNLPLAALLDDDVLLALSVDGKPLSREHGGPVRLVVPKRYFWKSAKWLKGIEFHAEDRPGFWEVRGYHNDADPWQEERFGRQ